jgi:hypothetical protein
MKTYERTFCSLPAQGGQRNVWALKFPGECQLTKLAVTQEGGTSVGFAVDIFNCLAAVQQSESSSGNDTADGVCIPDPHNSKVVDTVNSDSPGMLLKFFDDSVGHFVNNDVKGSTNRTQMIYLQIEPQGSGDMTFDVTLGCIRDIG